MMRFFYTLKFQISLALLFLVLAMMGTIFTSQYMLEEILRSEKIIQLGGKLQNSSQQMSMQAMNYLANKPEDDSAYERDLNLYYKNLMSHINTFDMIEEAFMSKKFSQDMTGMDDMMEHELSEDIELVVKSLHKTWLIWRAKLMERLGQSASMPKLELAASYINENGSALRFASNQLIIQLTENALYRKKQLEQLNHFFLIITLLTVIGIIFWFYKKVIKPLDKTSQAMSNIALGNFKLRLPVTGHDEINRMNQEFNHLSHHLDSIFQLITRLQKGGGLDEILRFISEEFSKILPLDWIGILLVTGDNKIQLERGYTESRAESFGSIRFDLKDTLLEQSMLSQKPLHIPDIESRLKENKVYKFLNILIGKGCKEAIFSPLEESSALRGVLVFASKNSHAYTAEHLALLHNISLLITLSFSRTVKLSEYQHLAAIGRFATGIAHEIRSPLATIGMAIDYFKTADLNESMSKRALLASEEIERVDRLMKDILIYSKPLKIKTAPQNINEIILDVTDFYLSEANKKLLRFELTLSNQLPMASVDIDRIKQVLINLLLNAIHASEEGGILNFISSYDADTKWINVQIKNMGKIIPVSDQEKIFEPFYTTKEHGTGLGLNIVKRIIEAHGGIVLVTSNEDSGTTFKFTLPPLLSDF